MQPHAPACNPCNNLQHRNSLQLHAPACNTMQQPATPRASLHPPCTQATPLTSVWPGLSPQLTRRALIDPSHAFASPLAALQACGGVAVWRVACGVWRVLCGGVACGVWRVACGVWRVGPRACSTIHAHMPASQGHIAPRPLSMPTSHAEGEYPPPHPPPTNRRWVPPSYLPLLWRARVASQAESSSM